MSLRASQWVTRHVLLDITPVRRSRDYRALISGLGISVLGNQLTTVAVPFQVYAITRSSLMVGLVSLTQLFPLIFGSLLGGSLWGAVDRRRLLLSVEGICACCSAGLALNSDFGPALWPLFLLPAITASQSGIDSSARNAMLPGLVGMELLPASNAMVFGMPRALFPALAATVFGGGATTVGLLYAAPGAGALLGALTTGWVGRVRRQGLAVICAVIVWGGAIAGFGVAHWLPLALVLLAVAGWADVLSAVFRNTIIQFAGPDGMRGRLMGVQMAVVAGGPRLGDLEAGAVATAFGDTASVVSGGLACVVGAFAGARALAGVTRRRCGLPHH